MTNYKAKSVVVSRKPGKDKDGLWSAFIGLFDENNPHLHGKTPREVVEIKEVEKVRVRDLRNISFYLMGNDLVVNNLVDVEIVNKEGVVTLTGHQELP
jgi:5,10-methylene-tetrahydrofolate dehydrogenase/methenyl tetrahydrofolate cyclohydrolase